MPKDRTSCSAIIKNETATKETFEGEWFKTGDVGYIDSDGFLHISGRKKNVIISKSGENVFPEEIEDIINRSPYVLESMVYAESNEKEGEIIAAQIVVDAESFIELSETKKIQITPEMIHEIIDGEIRKANRELSMYKQIKKFVVRDEEFQKPPHRRSRGSWSTPPAANRRMTKGEFKHAQVRHFVTPGLFPESKICYFRLRGTDSRHVRSRCRRRKGGSGSKESRAQMASPLSVQDP